MESLEQCRPDIWTLPDTSRECGTSSSGRNLLSNIIRTSGHSQTPPGSVGPVPPEGISRAMLSRRLNTPGHLQGVWDQFPQKESPEQCCPDVWTLPDTSRKCGTSSPRRNLRSNVVWMSGHSQTPPGSVGPVPLEGSAHSQTPSGSVGPVPLEGISGAMSSGHLHTPRHL